VLSFDPGQVVDNIVGVSPFVSGGPQRSK
jgi:hypothetical protein